MIDFDKFRDVFGKRLHDVRIRRCMYQKTLAYSVGVSPNTIGGYVNKRTIPDAVIFINICRVLNVDHHFMLGEHDNIKFALELGCLI